jgi:hypothetical protein
MSSTAKILGEIRRERFIQERTDPVDNVTIGKLSDFVDGTSIHWAAVAEQMRISTTLAARVNGVTWVHLVVEQVYSAMGETNDKNLRAELLQLAAVIVAWIEALDRREAGC